ncbi:hypothetical protein [Pseudomonas putida]|uniref:hypothetical protein n=1 Tax=Pseudomonas putida TaxID=303 RepID=UPI00265A0322|nr:hypothetical protein [Pseudomonas putida]MCZ9640392.1 hypothetical protein [Pseudomonas putida]HEE9764355.1 hypothetical protein [Pseudomonas putida]
MDKAELSRLLELQVQEKLKEGYSITTYALDAASRDSLKRGMKSKGHALPHENRTEEDWQVYIHQLDLGTYKPDTRKPVIEASPTSTLDRPAGEKGSGSVGLWKVRRH